MGWPNPSSFSSQTRFVDQILAAGRWLTEVWLDSLWTVVVVQLLSHVRLLRPHGLQHARLPCPSPSPGTYSNSCALSQWCHLTISFSFAPSPLALNLSSIRVFSSEPALWIMWPKYWIFNFSISPSNEYSGLISFRIYWFDLAVQGTLKSLLQYHSSKASTLWCSAFFIVQLSHLYMTTGKL